MSMREERKIIITLNPDELRKMADRMESHYAKAQIGDPSFVDYLGYSAELKVCLHYDQGWFEIRDKLAKPTTKVK